MPRNCGKGADETHRRCIQERTDVIERCAEERHEGYDSRAQERPPRKGGLTTWQKVLLRSSRHVTYV